MQAIETRYISPTNTRGSRYSASCSAKRIVVSYDYSLNAEDNHIAAATQLATQLGWLNNCTLATGTLKNGHYVHVLTENNS